jgi:tetratricopeptide (TPR) repeat protein
MYRLNVFKISIATALIAWSLLHLSAIVSMAHAESGNTQRDILAKSYASEGQTRTQQGLYREAEQAFKKSIQINPYHSASRQLYSNLLYRLGRLEEALVQIQKAVEISPHEPLLHTTVGEILLTLGRPE